MKKVIYGAAIALAILHHDFWYWADTTLVFGFMPIGLAYHSLFSLLAAGIWALAIKYAWPAHIDEKLELLFKYPTAMKAEDYVTSSRYRAARRARERGDERGFTEAFLELDAPSYLRIVNG